MLKRAMATWRQSLDDIPNTRMSPWAPSLSAPRAEFGVPHEDKPSGGSLTSDQGGAEVGSGMPFQCAHVEPDARSATGGPDDQGGVTGAGSMLRADRRAAEASPLCSEHAVPMMKGIEVHYRIGLEAQ